MRRAKRNELCGAGLARRAVLYLVCDVTPAFYFPLSFPSLLSPPLLTLALLFFRPMLNVVATRLLGEVSWGLKMRVIMGAGLSIMDMATDIFVIWGYMGEEVTKGYGWILLGMVAACMAIQLLVVFAQNKGKPWVLATEATIVLTGMKPAVDSYRVCIGQKMEDHHAFDAKTELEATKAVEMLCESIPGSLLQLYVLLKVKDVSRATVGSVIVSAMTTGFSSASISFE